jgi:hypothetical protein
MGEIEWSQAAKDAMQLWRKAQTFEELCELNARFMEGEIHYIPGWLGESLDPESDPIAPYLAAFNRAGFLTVVSQPGLDQGYSKQRAFVEGVALEATALKIKRLSLCSGLYIWVSRPGESGGCRTAVTIDDFRSFTWAGDDALDEETGLFSKMQGYEKICSDSAMQDLRQTCFVSVIDLCWGRTGYLWDTLAKELFF